MRGRAIILALVFAIGLLAGPAAGASSDHSKESFPRYRQLEPNVAFWRDIFAKYSKQHIVFHDPYHLDLVYSVADASELIRGDGTDPASRRAVKAHTAQESARIASMLRRLASAEPQTEEELRIAQLVQARGANVASYRELAERIRAQRGLADELCGALERAQPWLPEMKQVLAANGVPIDLASLPLVESGFRVIAHSSVGAAGIWQFTRSTGRRYMRIDHVVDERRDPLSATEAAARYLRENYEMLGTWPLAITAYNHGESGVAAAVRQLGTTDLGVIAENYNGRSFGFASRNFYAEFLAARDVMQNKEKYCPVLPADHERLERVEVGGYVSVAHLARCAGVEKETLVALNPALSRDVAYGKLRVPKGYRLWVPASRKSAFETAYAELPGDAIGSGQLSTYTSHRVRSGQTLSHIAKTYGVSLASLQRHNGIRDSRRLRVGQVLKIPGSGSSAAAVAAASPAAAHEPSARPGAGDTTYVVHRLARGQTLSHVAKRYGVSVASIERYNGIRNPRSLRAGQQLKIPRSSHAAVARTHRISRGQTLSQIAALYRTTVSALQKVNGISDPKQLRPGQVIQIPM